MLKVYTILCRAGTMDNYSYLLIDEKTQISAVVDTPEAEPIIQLCKELGITPSYILNTHHHFDHTDCNIELQKLFGAKIVANEADKDRIPGFDIGVNDGGTFAIGESIANIIDVSAHTQGHILWYFEQDKLLFTGDTLFNLSIGGMFECQAPQMFNALNKIKQLPDDVLFYPGHEYTFYGLNSIDSNSEYFKIAKERLNIGLPVAPITLGLEKQFNPYLKANSISEFANIF